MKDGLSEIICIIDALGSLKLIKNDAIGGFIKMEESTLRLFLIRFKNTLQ
jgi:hypothetical protein